MVKHYSITVKGKAHNWAFDVYANPKYVQDWRDDGLEIDEVVNTIPVWVVDRGLTKPWCFLQDIFNFRNPFESNKET